jgi:hypothetical protein
MATRGRPPYKPTEAERAVVQALSAYGTNMEAMRVEVWLARRKAFEIAGLPVSDDKPLSDRTVRKHFKVEMTTGLDRMNARVWEAVGKRAVDIKHPQGQMAAMYWLNTRGGQKPVARIEHTGKDGAPIEFGLLTEDATLEEVEVLERVLARREAKLRLVGGTDVDAA